MNTIPATTPITKTGCNRCIPNPLLPLIKRVITCIDCFNGQKTKNTNPQQADHTQPSSINAIVNGIIEGVITQQNPSIAINQFKQHIAEKDNHTKVSIISQFIADCFIQIKNSRIEASNINQLFSNLTNLMPELEPRTQGNIIDILKKHQADMTGMDKERAAIDRVIVACQMMQATTLCLAQGHKKNAGQSPPYDTNAEPYFKRKDK